MKTLSRKFLFILFLLFKFSYCNAQKDIDLGIDIELLKEKLLKKFADSINNIEKGKPLPFFLSDECIDNKASFWPDLHTPISIRKKILNKVNNRNALEILIESNDTFLKKICVNRAKEKGNPSLKVPDIDKPYCELILARIKELKE